MDKQEKVKTMLYKLKYLTVLQQLRAKKRELATSTKQH